MATDLLNQPMGASRASLQKKLHFNERIKALSDILGVAGIVVVMSIMLYYVGASIDNIACI